MNMFYNYNGQFIATAISEQLYSPHGDHLGRYIPSHKIYVDLKGNYLGQVPFANRLLRSDLYSFDEINFGEIESFGNIGYIGDIGSGGEIEEIDGFSDITISWK